MQTSYNAAWPESVHEVLCVCGWLGLQASGHQEAEKTVEHMHNVPQLRVTIFSLKVEN